MPASADQIEALRLDLDATALALSDPEVQDIYDQAVANYTDTASYEAEMRLIALRRIMASASKLQSYKQNESSVDHKELIKGLRELYAIWKGVRDDAVALVTEEAQTTGFLFRVF